jgi:hypothetical protein
MKQSSAVLLNAPDQSSTAIVHRRPRGSQGGLGVARLQAQLHRGLQLAAFHQLWKQEIDRVVDQRLRAQRAAAWYCLANGV